MARVAVVGGGLFGTTAAIHVARRGHAVHLFEEKSDLLRSASTINQYRIHRGYHYPRSPETTQSCIAGVSSFVEEYRDAVVADSRHLYGIAREDSKTSLSQFMQHCDAHGLFYRAVSAAELINPERADAVEVVEDSLDPGALGTLVKKKLAETGVEVHLGASVDRSLTDRFDRVVLAAYASNNSVLAAIGRPREAYQFEVCEKPVVTLPPSFGRTDIVIVDGPFMSVGPFGRSDTYVLGHVVHAIHATNIGSEPEIPPSLRPCLDNGVIRNPRLTRFAQFVEAGAQFIPAIAQARHVGSMYTVRTVLPDRDATDERPTLVSQIDEQVIQVFSGKLGNCVEAARAVAELI
jgi:glycine/D-amino acid oxidase-like deaminating enzyme